MNSIQFYTGKQMSGKQTKTSHANIMFKKNMKIGNQSYTLTHKIGHGNFGEVFLALKNPNKNSKKCKMVAIKVEREIPGKSPSLLNEIEILKAINKQPNLLGFPILYEHGFQKGNHFVILELLGPNLNDLMKLCGGKFSLKTTVVLGLQIFQRIQNLHYLGYVSRDIKPENFLMGIGKKSSMVYLVDFGLSKRYRDPRVNLHIPYRQQQDFIGTLRYASICSHLRIQNARRDDLQSICYMLIYFLFGFLPWQNTTHDTMEFKQRLILQKKMKTSPSQLCANIPIQFKNILQYCIELDYYQQPDYQLIHGQLLQLYDKILSGEEFCYDWVHLTSEKCIHRQDFLVKITPSEDGNKQFADFNQQQQSSSNIDEDEEESSMQQNSQQINRHKFQSKYR